MALVRFRPTHRQEQPQPLSQQDQPRQQVESDFDFERLPDHLFIRILEQLEFRQRFNIARVSHRFKQMSDLSVTLIESCDFDAKFPDVDTFRDVVGKFARNLRVARLSEWTRTMEQFEAISNLEFPRLADIEIEVKFVNQFPNFLARCPNIRRLKIYNLDNATIDLGQSIFPHVDSVYFSSCSSSTIERVLDACPNVKHFSMFGNIDASVLRKLDQFFAARVNSMESIDLGFLRGYSSLRDGFENLWHLRSLRVLKLKMWYGTMTFSDINAISIAFPNLQILQLLTLRLDGGCISTLSKLKNLIELDLHVRKNDLCDVDIYKFVTTSEAQGLRRFKIDGIFSLTMVAEIIERFPRLKNLVVRRVLDEESPCSAISNFAKQLRKFAYRDLKIVLMTKNQWLLKSRRVRRAIMKLRKAAGDDERRPGLKLDMYQEDLVSTGGFRKAIEIWTARMYHRIFC